HNASVLTEAAMQRNWIKIAERLRREILIPVGRAARTVPGQGRSGHVSAAVLVGWITRGKGGIYLDGIRTAGNQWMTSQAALTRFFAELSAKEVALRSGQAQQIRTETQARAEAALSEIQARRKQPKGV
ncbi:MAG: hypothetical protein EBZ69_07960, partial [Alphaproteobacteria bacterium]|nr:hypothetical protein [Alphaproteobacteria bacterium]